MTAGSERMAARVFACLQRGFLRSLVAALAFSAWSMPVAVHPCAAAAQEARNTAYTELAIHGLTSDADAQRVQRALAAVAGVLEARVSRENGRAYVILDGDAIPEQESLIQAVKAAGFDAGSIVGRDYQEYETFDAHEPAACANPKHRHDEKPTPSNDARRNTELLTLSKNARELKARFNQDADKLRLVVLLSPT